MFKELERLGFGVEQKYPGIYYVLGMWLPIQIVVIRQLSRENHSSFRVLSEQVDIEDVRVFLKNAEKMTEIRERRNIDAVLQASVNANYEEKARKLFLNMNKNGFSLEQIVLASGKSRQDVEDIIAGKES